MGSFPVKRITNGIQVPQPRQRVCDLQQGSIAIVAQSPEQVVRGRLQIHHLPALPQMLAILRAQNGSAARGKNTVRSERQGVQHRCFGVTKTLLPFALKVLANRTPEAGFNNVVGVDERQLQPARQLAADSGFSRAGKPDQAEYQILDPAADGGLRLTNGRPPYPRSSWE